MEIERIAGGMFSMMPSDFFSKVDTFPMEFQPPYKGGEEKNIIKIQRKIKNCFIKSPLNGNKYLKGISFC
jgi:hypothetical protein